MPCPPSRRSYPSRRLRASLDGDADALSAGRSRHLHPESRLQGHLSRLSQDPGSYSSRRPIRSWARAA
jgi:hypothetical protein